MTLDPHVNEYAPVDGDKDLRTAVANYYNHMYRKGENVLERDGKEHVSRALSSSRMTDVLWLACVWDRPVREAEPVQLQERVHRGGGAVGPDQGHGGIRPSERRILRARLEEKEEEEEKRAGFSGR